MSDLISRAAVAQKLGVAVRTLINADSRARAGLATNWNLPWIRIGSRVFLQSQDLEIFIQQHSQPPAQSPRAEVESIADRINKLFPRDAQRLRELACTMTASTPRRRKSPIHLVSKSDGNVEANMNEVQT